MGKSKIITDYGVYADDTLEATAQSGITGTTGNANFTFAGKELSDATTAKGDYSKALAAVATGNSADVTAKNQAKTVLVEKLAVLCGSINLQAGGDLGKLQTTGFPLAKVGTHQQMGPVLNFQVNRGSNAGTMELKVDKPNYTDHGTVFAYWDAALGDAPTNIDKWFHRSSNGHSVSLTGLTPGKTYPFAAAYKGADSDPLIWSAIISKMVGD